MLVQWFAVNETILELTAGRIGCFYKDEQTLFLLFTHICKWFDSIGTKVWVYGCEIFIKCTVCLASYLDFSKMSGCISCGSRTDISTLYITDHYQIFLMTIINGFLECFQTFHTKLLIHGDLRLYCRDQIVSAVDDLLVVLPDGICGTFQCLSILIKRFFLNMLRYIGKHRI